MFRLSERVNLAVHAMGYMAGVDRDGVFSVSTLAAKIDVSESHLAKVMQVCVSAGYLKSVRGARGGFMFAKAPETISVLEVYEMFEGPVTITPCFLGTPICKPGSCLLKGLNEKISDIIQSELSHLKIADLEVASHEIS